MYKNKKRFGEKAEGSWHSLVEMELILRWEQGIKKYGHSSKSDRVGKRIIISNGS
jgi:hypothetical protein